MKHSSVCLCTVTLAVLFAAAPGFSPKKTGTAPFNRAREAKIASRMRFVMSW